MKKNKTASWLVWQIFLPLLIVVPLFPNPSWAQSSTTLSEMKEVAGEERSFFGKNFALVIGVGDYEADWQDLPGISKDIQSVKDILKDLGFTVFPVENPSSMLLEDVFNTFINQYGQEKNAHLLIYFSGHGYTMKFNGKEIGFIVPADTPLPALDKEGFLLKALSLFQIGRFADRIKAEQALFVFDSCFSRPFFFTDPGRLPGPSLDKSGKHARQFITACSSNEKLPLKSVFRPRFVSALKGEADLNGDSLLTGTELGEFLLKTVSEDSQGQQHPQYGRMDLSRPSHGDFVFSKKLKPSLIKLEQEELGLQERRKKLIEEEKKYIKESLELKLLKEQLRKIKDKQQEMEKMLTFEREQRLKLEKRVGKKQEQVQTMEKDGRCLDDEELIFVPCGDRGTYLQY